MEREAMSDLMYKLARIQKRIDDEIRRERTLPNPSPWRLLRLKTLRLLVKDRLSTRNLKARVA